MPAFQLLLLQEPAETSPLLPRWLRSSLRALAPGFASWPGVTAVPPPFLGPQGLCLGRLGLSPEFVTFVLLARLS